MSLEYERDSQEILEDLWQLYDIKNSDDRSFNRIMIYPKHLLWKNAKVEDRIEPLQNTIYTRPSVVASFNTYEEPMVLHVLRKPGSYTDEKDLSEKLADLINELIQAYVIESTESAETTNEDVRSN